MNTRMTLAGTVAGAGLLGAVILAPSGCRSAPGPDAEASASPGVSAQGMEAEAPPPARGAAEIWSTTCIRCHNSRSPASLSDAEWDVATMHMRIQANLTAEEYRTIRAYLKASND